MKRCYKYFAMPASLHDAQLMKTQLKLAGDYRRQLVDIENRSRALQRALWAEPMRHIPIEKRAEWREKEGGNAILKAWTKTDEYKEWRKKITDCGYAMVKVAYATAGDAGLAWGTRLMVADAVEHARRTTAWASDLGNQPCNRMGVQIQQTAALTCIECVGGEDTRIRVGKELYSLGPRVDGYRPRSPERVLNRSGGLGARKLQELKIRVGSEGRQPVWATLHILMHRPLPPTAQIKWAWVQFRRTGTYEKWEVVFSLELADEPGVNHPNPDSAIGIDIGWRRRDNGMRVLYWAGTDGEHGEVVIPEVVERRKKKSADLQSIRDKHRNFMSAELSKLRGDAIVPPWLAEALRYCHQWLKVMHYVRLERQWAENRFEGDAEIYERLVAYLKQDRHLWNWQACNLTKMSRQIRGIFTDFAHMVCRRYQGIAVADIDLTELKEADDEAKIASRSIQRLAPGEAIRALRQAAPRYGATVYAYDPAYITRDCSHCGYRRELEQPHELRQICEKCGHGEDQDLTAAKNLIRMHAEGVDARTAGVRETKKMPTRRTRKKAAAA
jgi:transposase